MDVDITGINCARSLSEIKTEDPDATDDASSSFGDTLSTNDNASEASDTEFQSHLYAQEDGMAAFHSFQNPFPGIRKKKLTAHWKNFIRPLMWRSKWAELKIIELQKQARKYDRKLAAYEEKKKLVINQQLLQQQQHSPDFANSNLSSPFNSVARRRKRRRRVEDVTDIKSYSLKHSLFSYHEFNNKCNLDGSCSMAEETTYPENKNRGEGEIVKREGDGNGGDYRLFPDSEEESNDPLEQFMRKILNVKSHVQKLKSQLVSVISGNGSKLMWSCHENLGIFPDRDAPHDSHTSSEGMSDCQGGTHSKKKKKKQQQQQLMSEYDVVMGRGEVSRYNNIVVPDIIESNVSTLSCVDVTMPQLPQSGECCEAIMDNGHIHGRLLVAFEGKGKGEGEGEGEGEGDEGKGESGEEGGSSSSSGEEEGDDEEDDEEEGWTNTVYTDTDTDTNAAGGVGVGVGHIPVSKGKRGKRKGGSGGWKNRLLVL